MTRDETILILDLNEGHSNAGVAGLAALVAGAGARPVVRDVRDLGDLSTAVGCILSGGPADPVIQSDWAVHLLPQIIAWERRIPLLGVCLGFQLMARAYGMRLRRLERPKLGVYPVGPRAAAADDPLLAGLDTGALCFEARSWAVAATGSRVRILAGIDDDAMAARFAANAAGVSFHPEASAEGVMGFLAARSAAPDAVDAGAGAGLSSVHSRIVPDFVALALGRVRGQAPAVADG